MSRIDGVFDNFVGHLTSGLSGFVVAAFAASERAGTSALSLTLLPRVQPVAGLAGDSELVFVAAALRNRFVEILTAESRMPVAEIALLSVDLVFPSDTDEVAERRRILAAVPAYYGYDPVYHGTVSLKLGSGAERTTTISDRPSSMR